MNLFGYDCWPKFLKNSIVKTKWWGTKMSQRKHLIDFHVNWSLGNGWNDPEMTDSNQSGRISLSLTVMGSWDLLISETGFGYKISKEWPNKMICTVSRFIAYPSISLATHGDENSLPSQYSICCPCSVTWAKPRNQAKSLGEVAFWSNLEMTPQKKKKTPKKWLLQNEKSFGG